MKPPSLRLRARRELRQVVLVLALATGAAVASGCADQASNKEPAPTARARSSSSARPVDDATVAFLSKARAAHHSADFAESKEDLAGAIQALEKITLGPQPPASPEVLEVLADAFARQADLKSRAGRYDGALKDLEAGLKSAPDISYFRGHLYEVTGLVEERRMKELEASGDKDGAARAKERAIAAFEKAIEIQDKVIDEALRSAPSASAVPATSGAPK